LKIKDRKLERSTEYENVRQKFMKVDKYIERKYHAWTLITASKAVGMWNAWWMS